MKVFTPDFVTDLLKRLKDKEPEDLTIISFSCPKLTSIALRKYMGRKGITNRSKLLTMMVEKLIEDES